MARVLKATRFVLVVGGYARLAWWLWEQYAPDLSEPAVTFSATGERLDVDANVEDPFVEQARALRARIPRAEDSQGEQTQDTRPIDEVVADDPAETALMIDEVHPDDEIDLSSHPGDAEQTK